MCSYQSKKDFNIHYHLQQHMAVCVLMLPLICDGELVWPTDQISVQHSHLQYDTICHVLCLL